MGQFWRMTQQIKSFKSILCLVSKKSGGLSMTKENDVFVLTS